MDSDDDLLRDELSAALSSRPSRGHKYTSKGPLSPDGNKLLQDLMNKQAAERRKIEEIRASAPPMSSAFDDMDMDDDELEEDALASLLPSSKKKKGGREAEDEEVKMCLDNDDDIKALQDEIKGLGQGVDKVDMEKEDFGDWKGLGSVFSMAERSQMRSVEFRSFVRDAGQWDAGYRTLFDALVGAGDSLPDLLCALGVARWLGATRRRVPPHLMEWLLYVMALTDDPAMAHGAFLNIEALMRGGAKHLAEPRPVCLEGWVLPFSTVAKILEYYGIGRLSTSAGEEEEGDHGEIEFMVDVDTTVPEQHMLRSGIPPAVNLAGLLQTLSWAVEDGRVKMNEAEARRLLCCTLLLSIDRYLQADCPDELRELTAALLQTIPDSQWPSPAILDITNATLNSTRIKLSDDSAIHIARSLCLGESSDREKDLVASLASYVLTNRVLPEAADAVKDLSVLTEPETYACTLLDAMNSPDLDACFEESERTYRAAYCAELLCKTLAKRCIPRPALPTVHEKLAIFEKSRRLSMRDEAAQTTKDILTQEIRALRCLAPPSRGLRQTRLSFGTKSQESQD